MAVDSPPATRYCGVARDTVRLEPLGLITLCYHRASGRTHLLMEPSGEIMAHLWGRTLSLEQLSSALAEEFDVEGQADFAETLGARLAELAAIGLVQIRV